MMLGAPKDAAATRFVFDNEKWAHPVTLAPFRHGARCVTNAEFLAFVDGRWLRAARALVGGRLAVARRRKRPRIPPIGARRGGLAPAAIRPWLPLAGAEPVHPRQRVRSGGVLRVGRPPLAHGGRMGIRGERGAVHAGANLDHRSAGPRAADAPWRRPRTPFRQRLGMDGHDVPALSGLRRRPYADYSAPWFGDHRVLRGGSFATRSR